MRRTTLAITQVQIRGYQYFCVTCPKPGGGRIRRFFRCKGEAQTFLELSKIQLTNHGLAAFSLSEASRVEAVECSEKLDTIGSSITEATQFFLDHVQRTKRSCLVNAAIVEFHKTLETDGRSERYLGDIRVRLARFARQFGERVIADVAANEIDDWLRGLPVGGVTRNSFRRRLSALFGYAKKRSYVTTNPVRDTGRASEEPGAIGILTVQETKRLLEKAQPEMVPFWAIGAFAGLRSSEIQRLDWSEIDLQSGFIEVNASKSKTASRRLVTIQPNLRQWLKRQRCRTGMVCPFNFFKRANDDREHAELADCWPNNGLRHSFASYHLSKFANADKLALEMGNSARMIFRHYRELVKPREAECYWEIKP